MSQVPGFSDVLSNRRPPNENDALKILGYTSDAVKLTNISNICLQPFCPEKLD